MYLAKMILLQGKKTTTVGTAESKARRLRNKTGSEMDSPERKSKDGSAATY